VRRLDSPALAPLAVQGVLVTFPLWTLPLFLPLIALGLLVWLAIGLAVLGGALWETAVETW
jgi:hypothetical protein